MDFRFRAHLRVISIIVLAFFLWTFGGLCEIAYAIKDSSQHTVDSSQGNLVRNSQPSKDKKPEEKFQKTIEDIENILVDAVTDADTKKDKLRTKKPELETFDVEIRKQFRETEEKIKGLPEEIKQRHRDFVKRYEDNFNELKNNLDAIKKSKTKSEAEAAIGRTKAFLEKVRPPKKHIPLDPNKLPHRTAEPVFIEPRTTPEQFKEMQDKDHHASGIVHREPILVASAGSLDGLLSPNSEPLNLPLPSVGEGWGEGATPNSQLLTQNYIQIAQVTNAPTSADLAETIEVQFTPEIRAKAAELNYNPVKIYNWVRNNIEFVPTYGSIQGANMCLQTKQCNDFDTASLLIALLRASNIPAKYVYGTIELPIEKVMNWGGGFTDPMSALNLIASGGIPVAGLVSGGKIVMVRMEHVWAEAWVDMIPAQGAVHKQGDTWISLDASYKQYNYTQGIDIKSAVPFDAQLFIDQIKSTATINETEGYVTNVSSTYIQQTMQDYQTRVQNYITQNYPNATVGEVLGKKEIIKQEFPILLGTLPYKQLVVGGKYNNLPDSFRHKITLSVIKDFYDEFIGTPINITKSLPELAGKKITLSYSPATPQDEAVINSYLPKPHADGTPIQPNELPSSLPAYLINLKPELRIDGVVMTSGTEVGMGATESFTMTFASPKQSPEIISNNIIAGEYYGIALNLGEISQEQLLALKSKLVSTRAKMQAQNFTSITKDDILGDLLYTTALSYYAELDAINSVVAKSMNVIELRFPSEAMFSLALSVRYFYGIPVSVSAGGLAMDVDRDMVAVKSKDGDSEMVKQYMLISGNNGSALEHSVPEQLFSTPGNPVQGISAVKALTIANDNGIPIYTINSSNITSILSQLQVSSEVKADIQNAVNAGKEVTVSKTNITFNGWTGCGYIIIDPNTGAGAYMISGGLNGAVIAIFFGALLMIVGLFVLVATGPFAPMGILLVMAGMAAFIDGLSTYLGDLTEIEVDYFNCMLPVLVSNLFDAILGLYGGLFISSILLKIFDVVSTYEGINTVMQCIKILL